MRSLVLVCCLIACGDDGNRKIADAATQIDVAPLIDAAPVAVTVTVTHNGAPVVAVRTYFQNADSSVVSATMTDATGIASAAMAAGGYVTIVDPDPPVPTATNGNRLFTWAGVKPGDHLVYHRDNPPSVQMSVTIPTDTAHGTAADYYIGTSCPFSDTTIQTPAAGVPPTLTGAISIYGCTTADVMVVARNAATGALSSFYVPALTIADAGTLDLSAQAYVAAVPRRFTLNNHAGGSSAQIRDRVASMRGQVFYADLSASGNPATATANMPAAFTGQFDAVKVEEAPAMTDQAFVEWGQVGPYTTDFGSHLLPDFASAPSYDPATHTIAWTTSGGAVQPDFLLTFIGASRSANRWDWEVVGPPGMSIALPVVPTDVFDFNIVGSDTFNVFGAGTAKVPGGYDAVRAAIASLQGDPGDFAAGSTTPGVISFNSYQAQPQTRTVHQSPKRAWAFTAH